MTVDTRTAAARQKAVRQEALREQLAAGGHLQHVIDIAERLSNETIDLDQAIVSRLKAAADIKMKLIGKYLPDLKAVEASLDAGDSLKELLVRFVRPH
jgi:hypothetical protein